MKCWRASRRRSPEVVALTIQQVTTQVVREAVQSALTEVLSSPELLARLQVAASPIPAAPTPTQPELAQPTLRERLDQLWADLRARVARWRSGLRSVLGLAWQR